MYIFIQCIHIYIHNIQYIYIYTIYTIYNIYIYIYNIQYIYIYTIYNIYIYIMIFLF